MPHDSSSLSLSLSRCCVGIKTQVAAGATLPSGTCMGPLSSSHEKDDAEPHYRNYCRPAFQQPPAYLILFVGCPVLLCVLAVGLIPWYYALLWMVSVLLLIACYCHHLSLSSLVTVITCHCHLALFVVCVSACRAATVNVSVIVCHDRDSPPVTREGPLTQLIVLPVGLLR